MGRSRLANVSFSALRCGIRAGAFPMDLALLLQPRDLLVGFDPPDKWAAIQELVGHLVATGRVPREVGPEILRQVIARERSMSTGMERGIAIPHAAVDGVDRVLACMGIVARQEGLAFDAIDGQPARLVVLLVIPRSQKLLHIRTLADVARVLGDEATREALIRAPDAAAAHEALSAAKPTTRR
jgi:mannitol/fructose-specific phosphotransferase system IIA component (Ntr-type)